MLKNILADIKMEFIIEFLDPKDYYQYCQLLKQLTEINPDAITEDNFNAHFNLIVSNPLHKIIVAKYGNDIIGTITILIEPKIIHDLSYVAHIEDLVVDSNYRGCGIAKMLIDKASEIATALSCYKIILDCSEKYVNFYKKFGFEQKQYQMVRYLN